jgi:hypothetical protein
LAILKQLTPKEVRDLLVAVLREQCEREENAQYDHKIGLAACANVYIGLGERAVMAIAEEEAHSLLSMLKVVQDHSRETLRGEYSTGAATVGSIIRRFQSELAARRDADDRD